MRISLIVNGIPPIPGVVEAFEDEVAFVSFDHDLECSAIARVIALCRNQPLASQNVELIDIFGRKVAKRAPLRRSQAAPQTDIS